MYTPEEEAHIRKCEEESRQRIAANKKKYTDLLKKVTDEASFYSMYKDMLYVGLELYSKRRSKRAFDFRADGVKVNYLYDDGVSYGRAKWENLHRFLKVM
jgi:hypothetical protein